MEALLEELKEIHAILKKQDDDKEKQNEWLTIEDIKAEFNIGEGTVRKMFHDPELPVQTYVSPHKVMRKHFEKYFNKRHDYLSERKK